MQRSTSSHNSVQRRPTLNDNNGSLGPPWLYTYMICTCHKDSSVGEPRRYDTPIRPGRSILKLVQPMTGGGPLALRAKQVERTFDLPSYTYRFEQLLNPRTASTMYLPAGLARPLTARSRLLVLSMCIFRRREQGKKSWSGNNRTSSAGHATIPGSNV